MAPNKSAPDIPAQMVAHDRVSPIIAGHRIRAYPNVGQHDWLTLQCLGAHLAYNWAVSFQQIAEDFYAEVGDETDPLWREYPGLQYDELKEINKAWKAVLWPHHIHQSQLARGTLACHTPD